MMHDKRALQSGTSHNFGDGFARAFGIQYTGSDNKLHYVHQTSWGFSTRTIGAVIMVHSDDFGLVLPPRIAPVQVTVIPIQQKKEGVPEKANEILDTLKNAFPDRRLRFKIDDSDRSPGFKFAESEMRGIPIRIEVGPKDIEKGSCILVRRDTREKTECPFNEVPERVNALLEQIQKDMYERAKKHLEEHIYDAHTPEEFKELFKETKGFVRAMWCGDRECEDKIKEELGVTSRCMPFEQEKISDKCVCCGREAKHLVLWGRSY